MWILPGRRTIPPTPYPRHCSPEDWSFSVSHAMAALRPSGFNGTDSASPLGGTVMRERQSSVTSETQYPVISTGAAARGGGGGPGGGPNCAQATADAVTLHRTKIAGRLRIDILLQPCRTSPERRRSSDQNGRAPHRSTRIRIQRNNSD